MPPRSTGAGHYAPPATAELLQRHDAAAAHHRSATSRFSDRAFSRATGRRMRYSRRTRMAADLWTVTAYFNPCHYVTKKANFDRFAARLATIGARLLVVELALEDHGFELTDNDDVIRLR